MKSAISPIPTIACVFADGVALAGLTFMKETNVNLATEKATVTYNDAGVTYIRAR
jgi:hypothetical protein